MKTVYKYPLILEPAEMLSIEVPDGAVFLHVDVQQDHICLWAMVDTMAPMVQRRIRVIGTGKPAEDVTLEQYIGSVLVLNGTYVFHIFDVGAAIQ